MYPPFDELDDEQIANVLRHTHIEFYPAGSAIVQRAAAPSDFLYVVRKGVVHALDGEQIADVLGEGEFFGFVSIFTGLEAAFTIRAIEDTICYLIDQEIADCVESPGIKNVPALNHNGHAQLSSRNLINWPPT